MEPIKATVALSEDNLLTAARRVVRFLRVDEEHGGLLSIETLIARDNLARQVEIISKRIKLNAQPSSTPIE